MWVPVKYMTWLGKVQRVFRKLTSFFLSCKTALLQLCEHTHTIFAASKYAFAQEGPSTQIPDLIIAKIATGWGGSKAHRSFPW